MTEWRKYKHNSITSISSIVRPSQLVHSDWMHQVGQFQRTQHIVDLNFGGSCSFNTHKVLFLFMELGFCAAIVMILNLGEVKFFCFILKIFLALCSVVENWSSHFVTRGDSILWVGPQDTFWLWIRYWSLPGLFAEKTEPSPNLWLLWGHL